MCVRVCALPKQCWFSLTRVEIILQTKARNVTRQMSYRPLCYYSISKQNEIAWRSRPECTIPLVCRGLPRRTSRPHVRPCYARGFDCGYTVYITAINLLAGREWDLYGYKTRVSLKRNVRENMRIATSLLIFHTRTLSWYGEEERTYYLSQYNRISYYFSLTRIALNDPRRYYLHGHTSLVCS